MIPLFSQALCPAPYPPPHLLGGLFPKSQTSMFSEAPLLIGPSLLLGFIQPTCTPSMPSSLLGPSKPHLSMTVTDGPSEKLSHPLRPRVPLSPALWRHLAWTAPMGLRSDHHVCCSGVLTQLWGSQFLHLQLGKTSRLHGFPWRFRAQEHVHRHPVLGVYMFLYAH